MRVEHDDLGAGLLATASPGQIQGQGVGRTERQSAPGNLGADASRDEELSRLRLFELAVERANDAIIITTGDLEEPGPTIVYVNDAFSRLSGYSREEVLGATPRMLQGPDTNLDEMARMKSALKAGLPFVGEAINYRKDGTTYIMEWSVHALRNTAGGASEGERALYYVAIQRDITQRKRYEAQIEEQKRALASANERLSILSLTDSLTGLGNHRAFYERLSEEWARARRYNTCLSLILLDIDLFKSYNDSFGHPAGDQALQLAATLLKEKLRACDVAARHGGEEFALLLPQTDSNGALALSENIRQSFAQAPWPHRAVTVSLGVVTWRPDLHNYDRLAVMGTISASALVRAADEALYASKSNGRNQTTVGQILGELVPDS